MAEPLKKSDSSLYEVDFYAWTQQQAERLRARAHNAVDWENAAEEIESLGRSDKREICSRLEVLLHHLLKWEFQAEKRKAGWLSTIREQRRKIGELIGESPSLRSLPEEVLSREYEAARLDARDETGLLLSDFPMSCPYMISDIFDPGFLPGAPWSPETLIRD